MQTNLCHTWNPQHKQPSTCDGGDEGTFIGEEHGEGVMQGGDDGLYMWTQSDDTDIGPLKRVELNEQVKQK